MVIPTKQCEGPVLSDNKGGILWYG